MARDERRNERREMWRFVWKKAKWVLKFFGIAGACLAIVLGIAFFFAYLDHKNSEVQQQSEAKARSTQATHDEWMRAMDVPASVTPEGKIMSAHPIVFGAGNCTAITTEKVSLVIYGVWVVPIGAESRFQVQSNGWQRFTWDNAPYSFAVYTTPQ